MEPVFEAADCEVTSVAGGRLLRLRAAERGCLLEHWSGPLLPSRLSGLAVCLVGENGCRLQANEGCFEGRISGYQLIVDAPALFEPLVRPFEVKPFPRRVALVLLRLLRWPGGSTLLRAWHERRR